MEKFEKILGRDSPLFQSVKERKYQTPSEIQEKSIPKILEGKDVIALASTGSGKTLAFAAGLVKNVENNRGIQGLILVPTRELAEQVTKELRFFSKFKELNVIAVYGGGSINNQIRDMKNAEIVVATPGRLLDHINRQTIDLRHLNTLVLDEADRMFDMGFRDDVRKILNQCPRKRQTMLFSATFSHEIELLSKGFMDHPVEISAESQVDPSKLTQEYYDVGNEYKFSLLKHLIEHETAKLIMIFCNTRRNVDFVAKNLNKVGIEALPIHGGFSQDKRNKVIAEFHSNSVHVLVATDVAARGLHIEGVSHIYNYDAPPTKNEYIHRIGRTARAGKEGKVINILSMRDYDNFRNINDGEFNIIKKEMPEVEKVMIKWVPERNDRDRSRGSGYRGSSHSQSRSRSSGGRSSSSSGRSSFGHSRSDSGNRSERSDSRGGRSDFRGGRARDSRPSGRSRFSRSSSRPHRR